MAISNATENTNVREPHYRQVISPNYLSASYTADDTDNHDFRFPAAGKGRATIHVDNPSDQDATVSVYGAPDTNDPQISDSDVVQIGSSFTVSSTSVGYETVNDPFPMYIVRSTHGSTPDSSTVSVYVHFHSA